MEVRQWDAIRNSIADHEHLSISWTLPLNHGYWECLKNKLTKDVIKKKEKKLIGEHFTQQIHISRNIKIVALHCNLAVFTYMLLLFNVFECSFKINTDALLYYSYIQA